MTFLIAVLVGVVLLMFSGVPVGFAFGLGGFILCGIYDIRITGALSASFNKLNMFAMMALPLFILLGSLMNQGGLAKLLIDFVNSFIGRKKGGLGYVLILTNTIFGAMCGVATSAMAAIGGMLIPAMEEKGYPRGYSTGIAIPSSVLSLLIPPSTSMIIFGIAGRVSIPLLFAATFIPGVILTILLCIINKVMTSKIPTIQIVPEVTKTEARKEKLQATRKAVWILLLPLFILVGIYSGAFTPTEAAGVSTVYALVLGFFIYRSMNMNILWNTLIDGGKTTGSIVMVFFFFFVLSRILILEGVPSALLNLLLTISENKIIILLIFNILLFLTGMFMDDCSALILAGIIYLPAAVKLGINPIHFGAICGVNLGMGLITPPVAPLLYMGGMIGGNLEIREYYKPVVYSILFGYLPVLILTTYIPELSLTLPKLLMNLMG
ncbi:MAG: TRAP transporter large permease [Thermovirgaceae bacterium]